MIGEEDVLKVMMIDGNKKICTCYNVKDVLKLKGECQKEMMEWLMADKEGMNKGCIVKVDWDYEDEEDNKIRWLKINGVL